MTPHSASVTLVRNESSPPGNIQVLNQGAKFSATAEGGFSQIPRDVAVLNLNPG